MNTKEEIIEKFNLLPLVPLTSYSKKPFCLWSKEENWIKNIENCNIKKFSWINKDGQEKQGQVTGFSLLLGKKSNITVIDLDVGHSDGINGIDSFKELIKDLPKEDIEIIKSTFVTQTPRGGYHLYFKYVEGIKGIANYFSAIGMLGIDVRTEGNLVPIPGTRIQLDRKSIATYSIKNDSEIKPMPQSLIDLFLKHQSKPQEKVKRGRPKESSKYYRNMVEGEGRNSNMMSWLGHIVKNNPNLRNKAELLPLAEMYSNKYHTPSLEYNIIESQVNRTLVEYADPPYIDSRKKVIRGALANVLISDIKYKYYMGKNYTYNGSYYEEWGSIFSLRNKIYSYISTENEDTKMANEVISLMHDKTNIESSKDFEYITVNNGLLHLRSNKLISHNENIFTTIKIDCDFKKDWKSEYKGSNIQRFLNTTFKNDTDLIDMAIEIMGMSLLPNPTKCEKHILLMGKGNNGKSIYMNLIKSLHGGYVSAQTTDKLCDKRENKFCTSSMVGKRLNLVDDENDVYMKDTGLWKSIVTGGVVSIEFKGQTATTENLNILLISGTNHTFKSKDTSDGFYRRFLILPFNQKFVDKNKLNLPLNKDALPRDDFIESNILDNEMHILLGLALEGLQRVLKRHYKFKSIKATNETLDNLKAENDPIYEFITFIQNSKYFIHQITGSQFRTLYEHWCEDNNKIPVGSRTFGENAKKYYEFDNGRNVLYFNVDMPKEYLELLGNIKYSLKQELPIEEIQPKTPVKKTGTWADIYK